MTTLLETPVITLVEDDDDGRHRLGRPGLAQRRDLVIRNRRRAQHRRVPGRARMTTEGIAILIAIMALIVLVVGGWYAAPGAHAVSQMLAQ